ncbi:M43 family zinc metalloprotease [Flavobacterium sp. DG1-102-2]|uniref:M43 family zinc metalloprotease n=1 Tax=Flavobacterium sp. DG1-102-2 TaxID=3081663 RepID=UPI002948DFFB|nr:M43 family zinc metalloprotease [Flavobacterium sp. DG1-102-2]MDV6169388.1 M43 family zinc metalloprotease [Flavobacterium sp. DG1-102-2]
MKKFTFKASLFVFAGMLSLAASAQQKPTAAKKFGKAIETVPCATVQYETLLKKKNPARNSTEKFEQWIAPKVAAAKKARIQKNSNAIVTIPVVFHIIHNGSPIGVAENIADGQIISQIDVLNEDYRRLEGSNGHNESAVGGDMEINFCLAQQDPDGVLSTGIVRYQLGNGDGWSMEQAEVIKTQTQWDPEKYLNIWVFDELIGLAGYAQFPTDSGLDGLEEDGLPSEANTDGVALGHRYVGSEEKYPQGEYDEARNLGRSASHEVGHFFGLRHIWGDGEDCSATDYCADTPPMLGPNYGCQTGLDTCTDDDLLDMIENYMAYTDDACVNIFTLNQKDRMQAVLENSPRRHSLITSVGCTPGIVLENDGSLQINPVDLECGETAVEPELVLTNSGSSVLTSASISYQLDSQPAVTYNWTGSLAAGASATIELPAMTLTAGQHILSANIVTVNGTADVAPNNSSKSLSIDVSGLFTTSSLKVSIQTDDNGDQTLWFIAREGDEDNIIAGNINIDNIGQSEFYGDNELHVTDVPVSVDDCYAFFIIDFGADGMCCNSGNGYYKIETNEGVVITEGGNFTQTDQKMFAIDAVLSNHEVVKAHTITLYPNPANNILNISADAANMPESYTVYNSLGQVIDSGKVTAETQSVDVAKYANGVYFVKLAKGGSTTTLQFIKQ